MIPMIPHMARLLPLPPLGGCRACLELRTKRGSASFLCFLPGATERQGARRDVLGDHAACGDIGSLADADRRDQRAVGADEGLGADHRAVLAVAVVVHKDRAGADVARRADIGVAEIGEMARLGAAAHPGRLELDEVADMDILGDVGAWSNAGARADDRTLADPGALDVAKPIDADVGGDRYTGAEAHVGAYR